MGILGFFHDLLTYPDHSVIRIKFLKPSAFSSETNHFSLSLWTDRAVAVHYSVFNRVYACPAGSTSGPKCMLG